MNKQSPCKYCGSYEENCECFKDRCAFCRKEMKDSRKIIDKETNQEIFICLECYKLMKGGQKNE